MNSVSETKSANQVPPKKENYDNPVIILCKALSNASKQADKIGGKGKGLALFAAKEYAKRVILQEMKNAAKTHCPKGHPYSGNNLDLYRYGKYVFRRCRTCQQEHNEQLKAKAHEARPH